MMIIIEGKTTILRSIVGRLTLDAGEISVLGKKPGSRGHGIPGNLKSLS